MSVLSPALLGAVGLVLLVSAAAHLRSPSALRRGLDAQDVLPGGVRGAVTILLGPVEAVLGAGCMLAAATGPGPAAALSAGLPAAVLLLVLGGYLVVVLRATRGRPVPCACGLGETPVAPAAVLRAGVLAAMAALGAVTADGWTASGAPAREVFVALAAALVLAVATVLLPAARSLPDPALRGAVPDPAPAAWPPAAELGGRR